jgi:hypothetical protein
MLPAAVRTTGGERTDHHPGGVDCPLALVAWAIRELRGGPDEGRVVPAAGLDAVGHTPERGGLFGLRTGGRRGPDGPEEAGEGAVPPVAPASTAVAKVALSAGSPVGAASSGAATAAGFSGFGFFIRRAVTMAAAVDRIRTKPAWIAPESAARAAESPP